MLRVQAKGWSPYRSAVAVDEVLHINAYSTGALIQDGKLGLMVEQTGHLDTTQREIDQ